MNLNLATKRYQGAFYELSFLFFFLNIMIGFKEGGLSSYILQIGITHWLLFFLWN